MKPPLIGEAQSGPAASHWRLGQTFDPRKADRPASFKLAVEQIILAFGREAQIAIEPPERARDGLFLNDSFNSVDCRGLPLEDRSGPLLPVHRNEAMVVVIEFGCEMSSGTRRHAATDIFPIDHHDRSSAATKLVGYGEPGNAGADDHSVGCGV
jgi:hypothetical protein